MAPPCTLATRPRSANASMSRRIVMSETPSTLTRSATRAPPCRRTRSSIDACLCCASTDRLSSVPIARPSGPVFPRTEQFPTGPVWVVGHGYHACMPVRPGVSRAAGPRRAKTSGRDAVAPVVVRAADGLTRWITRVLGASATAGRETISETELRDLVAANTRLAGEERRIIDEVLTAAARHVREVM